MEVSQKIVIIGAGIGGLASGYFLQEAGHDVEIHERAPIPGGRIKLLEREGARIDVGAQYFHTNYVETLKLLDSLELKDALLPIQAPVMLMRNGHGFLTRHSTLRYRVVPLISNLKFGRVIWTALSNFGRLDPYYNDPLEEFESIDLAEYILQKCGEEVLEFLVRPIVTAFNLSDPEGESLAHFLRIAKQFLTASDTCLPTGMFSLPDTLAKKLPVTYDSEALEIQTESNQVTGVRSRIGSKTRTIKTSNVICATPLKELSHLLPIMTDEERSIIREFTYSGFPLAVFFMKRRLPANHWAYVFSRTEGFKTSFASDAVFKCDQMVPSGRSILQIWFTGEAGTQLVNESDQEILALAREEMTRILPDFDQAVESVEVVRHHTGMPRYRVGIYPKLRTFLKDISRIHGLHLVGDYYGHSTIETVVRSAHRATQGLLSAGRDAS
jgi:oxygen-dependent protoporphyrinogen oxidase